MIKYVLFDFDGTVYDTAEGITKSIRWALNKRGMDAELHELRKFVGPPLAEKFMEVYGFGEKDALEMVRVFRERYAPVGIFESAPFPGIRELLLSLKAAGLVTGVATSKPQNMAEQLIERSALTDCFDIIVGSFIGPNNDKKWEILTWWATRSTTLKVRRSAASPASASDGATPPRANWRKPGRPLLLTA